MRGGPLRPPPRGTTRIRYAVGGRVKRVDDSKFNIVENIADIATVDINELFAMEPGEDLCLLCVHAPCLCDLVKLELKIEMLRDSKEAVKNNPGMNFEHRDRGFELTLLTYKVFSARKAE